ncbi:MAG: D-alanyl-D-alanine carboxypeptidase family protein [Acidimicrobiales bacterium]
MTLILGLVLCAFAATALYRSSRQLPVATIRTRAPSTLVVSGRPVRIVWPLGVQAAVAVPAIGFTAISGPEVSAPVASLTKLMTAYLVLKDHPLGLGEQGPQIAISAQDVTLFDEDQESDQASYPVSVGEQLSEYQMLEGMLVHSANNFADMLAAWDAASVPSFVAMMNGMAVALGMTHTHYVDPSGYDQDSVSTPADQLALARLEIRNPVFNQIVDMPSVTLPVGGAVDSYTPLVGEGGVVGLKSGFTSAAGGCDLLGLIDKTGGRTLEVLSAVTGARGAEDVISESGALALSLARSVADGLVVQTIPAGTVVGRAILYGRSTDLETAGRLTLPVLPGQRITESLSLGVLRAGARSGTRLGWLRVRNGPSLAKVRVVTGRGLGAPDLLERIF